MQLDRLINELFTHSTITNPHSNSFTLHAIPLNSVSPHLLVTYDRLPSFTYRFEKEYHISRHVANKDAGRGNPKIPTTGIPEKKTEESMKYKKVPSDRKLLKYESTHKGGETPGKYDFSYVFSRNIDQDIQHSRNRWQRHPCEFLEPADQIEH